MKQNKITLNKLHSLVKKIIKEELSKKKYELYRVPSNSPSPGHGYYLFCEADTLEELFNMWIDKMKRGGYSIDSEWINGQKQKFDADQKNYFVTGRGSLFYKLKTNYKRISK